jgi:hypothetical protein
MAATKMSKTLFKELKLPLDTTIIKESSEKGKLASLRDASTNEVIDMVMGRNEIFGRMSNGANGDLSDFDVFPKYAAHITKDQAEGAIDFVSDGPSVFDFVEGEPAPFQPPVEEQFPTFKRALRHFQAIEAKPRSVRIDTEETFGAFVCDRAVKELDRRIRELRAAVEHHVSDPSDPEVKVSTWDDIVGAAQAISDLSSAKSASEATDAMNRVPLDLPDFAEDKVKAWKDGEYVVCTICFMAADGSPRRATMAAKPKVDMDDVVGWIRRKGVNPVHVLGAISDLADVACAKRLVKDVAGAALKAHNRLDVVAGDEPVLLASTGNAGGAPLAALMYTQQQADLGDPQAAVEMAKIDAAANATPSGQKVAKPFLAEMRARLSHGRTMKAMNKPSLIQRFLKWVS